MSKTVYPYVLLIFLLKILALAGCSYLVDDDKAESSHYPLRYETRAAKASLSMTEAHLRKAMIANVDYELSLDLTGKGQEFTGRVFIDLEARFTNQPLTIDFDSGEIRKLILNNQQVEPVYNGFFLTIPPGMLQTGKNQIEIEFYQSYSRDGEGLYRFIDPEDNQTYLYSHFEPHRANRVFPLLEQPDLKARFKLNIKAPEDWQVVSSRQERRVVRDGKNKWWYFPVSEPMAAYVLPIHAGPYDVWEDKQFRIPLRLMARKSQKKKVQAEEWFRLTRLAFDYYENYFDIPYPYQKYDQLIVPDLNVGAMENLAAVTVSESILSESISSDPGHPQRMYVAVLLFHELAHIWFGNLVTMDWWNGLWLNESFADFMAYKALQEVASLPGWLYFQLDSKMNAYSRDLMVTTHPVERAVLSSDEAWDNFDAIAYGKGAAALQQLEKQVGEDVFRQGIREYLHRHKENNTRQQDFISALESASGQDLGQWSDDLLKTAGVNEINARFSCRDGDLYKLEIIQQPAATGDIDILREQSINIALLMLKNDHLSVSRNIPVTYSGRKTRVEFSGRHPCPAMVFPNSDDKAYVMVSLDEQSRQIALQYPLRSKLLQNLVLQSLRNDLRKGQISLAQFAEKIISLAERENDALVLEQYQYLLGVVYYLSRLVLPNTEKSAKEVTVITDRVEQFNWQMADLSVNETSQYWFDHWVTSAHSKVSLARMADIISGKKMVQNFPVQAYQRWNMIIKLNEFNWSGAEQLITQESCKDSSSSGQLKALAAWVARPSLDNKRYWFEILLDEQSLRPHAELATIAHHLFPRSQLVQARAMAQEILDNFRDVQSCSPLVQARYSDLLVNECSADGVQRLDRTLEQLAEAPVSMINVLKETRQQTERCMAISNYILP